MNTPATRSYRHRPLLLITSSISLIVSVLFGTSIVAQSGPIRYIPPMDHPIELSGNFMEPRNDHFHSGLDIRTQGREGLPVKAVADGWVSRIKISPWGYGKAVYIDHPDGHTSVYGHLQVLQGPVAKACLDAQYRQEDFSIDLTPDQGAVPVKQGEVIALSGNTGGSGGPHLHFELRRTSDQHALDPEALGIRVPDRVKPEIIGVRLYPLTDTSRVGPYPGTARGFPTEGTDGRYTLKGAAVPQAYGSVGLALHVIDRYDGLAAKCGVRRIELFVDSAAVFTIRFDEIDFNTTRYCNAHMDHALFKAQKMEYHRCYKQPNDKLRIYGQEEAQGRINVVPGQQHQVLFRATDAHGNVSELRFALQGGTPDEAAGWTPAVPEGALFRYDTENELNEEGITFTLPALSLYDDAYLRYARRPAPGRAYAPLHVLHEPLTPLQTSGTVRILVPTLPAELGSKAVVVRVDDGGKTSAVGGSRYAAGAVSASIRAFGAYTVMVDTVPPSITNVDLKGDMTGRSRFTFKVADNLSGVEKYRATIDGKWVLMEYEPKTKSLIHTFDAHSKGTGSRKFELEVTDERGNTARYEQVFKH